MTKFKLTKSQLIKVHQANKTNTPVTLILSKRDISTTGQEIKVDKSLLSDGKRHKIVFYPPVRTVTGGFLPLIPIIAGLIAAGATAAGGIATAVKSAKEAKAADAMATLAEAKKKQIESGSGVFLRPYCGKGTFLNPFRGRGQKKLIGKNCYSP